MGIALCRDQSYDRALPSYWPSYIRPSCYEKNPANSSLDIHRFVTADTGYVYYVNCGLASTVDSKFELVLVGGIRLTVGLNFSTLLPTAVGRLILRRLVGRCGKIRRCVPGIIPSPVNSGHWSLYHHLSIQAIGHFHPVVQLWTRA